MGSIQRRIGLALLVSLLLAGGLLAQGSLWLFDRGLRSYLQSDLRDEAESLLRAIARKPSGVQLETQLVDPSFQRPYSGRYFLIDIDGQLWRSRSLWDREMLMPSSAGLQEELQHGPQGQHLLVYCASFKRQGLPVRICVAQDYNPVLQAFTRMQQFALGFGAGLLLLLLLVQRWAVRSALRPLEQARLQVGFQFRHLAGYRRGRQSEALGGPDKASRFNDLNEGLQSLKPNHGKSLSRNMGQIINLFTIYPDSRERETAGVVQPAQGDFTMIDTRTAPYAAFVLRVALGVMFVAHALLKYYVFTLSGTAQNLTYTPAAGWAGADSFTFVANDGQADSVPATVSITVTPGTATGVTVSASAEARNTVNLA